MNCPTCPQSVLVMADRAGIEIDYCPTCRGVWLDRGELDKIIERSAGAVPAGAASTPTPAAAPAPSPQYQQYPQQQYQQYPQPQHSKKKKSSFLGDIFDF